MIYLIVFSAVGVFLFIFSYWRKLKEDYVSNQIFSSVFYILFFIGLGLVLSLKFFPSWWFWIMFIGFLAGIVASYFRFGLRFTETFEAAFISILPLLFLSTLAIAITKLNVVSLAVSGGYLVIIFIYYLFNSRYKNFGWYKSGKIGFASYTTLGIYFLVRGVTAFFFPFIISFTGLVEPVLSGLCAFASFLGVYILSQKI